MNSESTFSHVVYLKYIYNLFKTIWKIVAFISASRKSQKMQHKIFFNKLYEIEIYQNS